MASLNTAAAKLFPGLGDKLAAKMLKKQLTGEPASRDREGALYNPSEDVWQEAKLRSLYR
jgi:hypothetical protein